MKTQSFTPRGSAGNTLLLTLVITALIGFMLLAYLNLVRAQNAATMRSQSWNATVPVIEAGIEEALTHLNAHAGGDLACDGWTQDGLTYSLQRNVASSYYVVTITNYIPGILTNAPIIESRGYVALPAAVAAANSPAMFAASGVASPSRSYLGRGVRVTTKQDFVFSKGMVAKFDLNGNNILTDSFDSSDPNYSTSGLYDEDKRKANGDVASNSGITNSLNVGNATIYGHVSTGPGGSVAIGPNGSVGDEAWHDAGKKGIQPGYYTDDMNVEFPDVQMPFSGGAFTPTGGYVTNADGTVTYYDYLLDDGNYQLASLNGKTFVRGNAVLLVTGSINLSGQDSITIMTAKTLKLYMAGGSASLGGNGVINQAGNATNFSYYGLPGNTNISISGNGTITGTVYAPNAHLALNGGGHEDTDFVGATVTRSAKLNGHFSFHYDEALAKYGPSRGYVVTSWNELSPAELGASVVVTTTPSN
jgi:hypothetical protein